MRQITWIKEYMAENVPGAAWNAKADFALRLCMKCADDACIRYVLDAADAFIRADGCTPANAKVLFFALEKTGEDKYREAIQQVKTKLDEQPEAADAPLSALHETLPFRMAYEMKLNRMEKVGATAAMFRSAHQRLWDRKTGMHGDSLQEEGWFLLALTDAIAVCSDQLYEHWRAMVDIYRETLRGVLPLLADADTQTMTLLLYALLTGVEMGLIDPERYLPVARKGIAALRDKGSPCAADTLEEGLGVL